MNKIQQQSLQANDAPYITDIINKGFAGAETKLNETQKMIKERFPKQSISKQDSALLKKFENFFADKSKIKSIREYIDIKSYKAGEFLIEYDRKSCYYLFYIDKGKATLHPNQGYYYAGNLIFDAPWFTGENELFRGKRTRTGVKALTDCVCVRVEMNDKTKEILRSDAGFLYRMCEHYANKSVKEGRSHIDRHLYGSLEQNIAAYFLEARVEHTEYGEVRFNEEQYAGEWDVPIRLVENTINEWLNNKYISINSDEKGIKPMSYILVNEDKISELAGKKYYILRQTIANDLVSHCSDKKEITVTKEMLNQYEYRFNVQTKFVTRIFDDLADMGVIEKIEGNIKTELVKENELLVYVICFLDTLQEMGSKGVLNTHNEGCND
jgi:hypothetical protein